VVAAPPGRGRRELWKWRIGLAAYGFTVPLGALAAGALLHLGARGIGYPPPWVFASVAAVGAVAAATGGKRFLPQSRWRVPREWGARGRVPFAAIFGSILGVGILTALPSPGFLALLVWALAASSWSSVWPVFLAYGAGRAVPLLVLAVWARRRQVFPAAVLDRADVVAENAAGVEAALLGAGALLVFL
jgi:hypothetical protein